MKKFTLILITLLVFTTIFSGCKSNDKPANKIPKTSSEDKTSTESKEYEGVYIKLSDKEITVDDELISEDPEAMVYTAKDIVYYEDSKDFTYGEGSEEDAHTKEEADAHTVVHITKPGQYILNGKLSKGQIAIDLGKDAKNDPESAVTLVLNEVDITCEVAPAVIFYNVYECGSTDTAASSMDVDTAKAGANVIIADDTENNIEGSYVARIYEPESILLSTEGTEVEDAKKLHKYDGAFYSKMSMNVSGAKEGNGILNIKAENEGLCTELHLTINGGIIKINSGNDGINTNEDNVSVTTVNGGELYIRANGATGEGDGIDSNGWLVINGGKVHAEGCAISGDAGIDSDMGIHINGGTVFAAGNMLDRISESNQNYAVFSFTEKQASGFYILKNAENEEIITDEITNAFTYLIISCESLEQGDYTLWLGDMQLKSAKTGESSINGIKPFEGTFIPERTEPIERPPAPLEKTEPAEPPLPPDGRGIGDFKP